MADYLLCKSEVYLPDGWLHATVSIGPTVAFTRNAYDSTVLAPPLGSDLHFEIDEFGILKKNNDETLHLQW